MNRLFFRPEHCGMTKTDAAAKTLGAARAVSCVCLVILSLLCSLSKYATVGLPTMGMLPVSPRLSCSGLSPGYLMHAYIHVWMHV